MTHHNHTHGNTEHDHEHHHHHAHGNIEHDHEHHHHHAHGNTEHDHEHHHHYTHGNTEHDHEHHHHHAHGNIEHDHEHHHNSASDQKPKENSEGEMPLIDKFSVLLKHWIDHNNSHKDSYISWANKAETDKITGHKLTEVAKFLKQSVELSEKITENLENALKSLTK